MEVKPKDKNDKLKFKVNKDGTLKIEGALIILRVTATDTQGLSDSDTASPEFPAEEDGGKKKGKKGDDDEGSEDDD